MAESAWEWASQHMTSPPKPFEQTAAGPNIPAAMKSAVMKALAKKPEDRFATVTEFLEAFKADGAPEGATKTAQVIAQDLPHVASGETRAKTEVGAAFEVAPGFGGTAPVVSQPPIPSQQPIYSAQPQLAPPVPPGPQPQQGGGGGKIAGILLAVLIVLGGGFAALYFLVLRKPVTTPLEPDSGAVAKLEDAGHAAEEAGSTHVDTADASDEDLEPLKHPDASTTRDAGPLPRIDAGVVPIRDAGVTPPPKDAGGAATIPFICQRALALQAKGGPDFVSARDACIRKHGKFPP
jgi:serine/threonine-protein kinase